MRTIDDPRNPETTYHVTCDTGLYRLTIYPRLPQAIALTQESYRLDLLPLWLQDAIRFMDVAGENVKVEGIGVKIGGSYWIEPD